MRCTTRAEGQIPVRSSRARGVYTNDLGDEGLDRVRSAYGDKTYQRLVKVKDRLDPENVFRRNQNIRPSLPQT